jgi:tetratricopeptide (TPR) repeat protein
VANYVHRPRLQQKIKNQLQDTREGGHQETQTLVIHGLGGAGKSQLVLNYIRECRQDYAAIFWIEAGQKESIERDYIQIYRLLFGRAAPETIEDAVPAVKSWFHRQTERLLVVLDSADTIDNADDTSYIDLGYFLPDAASVDNIITTRSSRAQDMSTLEAVEVGEMEADEAAALFCKYAKLNHEAEVLKIVKELGYLALAITLAGSYVATTPHLSSNLRQYLREYRERRQQLLALKATKLVHQYGQSVLSTWETSFSAVAQQSPMASRFLSLVAFLNFDDIFLDLFNPAIQAGHSHNANTSRRRRNLFNSHISAGDTANPSRWRRSFKFLNLFNPRIHAGSTANTSRRWRSFVSPDTSFDRHDVESAFTVLQTYSLVRWQRDQGVYTMHKLVHAWGRDRLEMDQQRELSVAALELLTDVVPAGRGDVVYRARLVPHVMANFDVVSTAYSLSTDSNDVLGLVDVTCDFLRGLGRWSDLYQVQSFHFRKMCEVAGVEDPSTLTSMSNLALVLSDQGKYEEVEQMHREVLAVMERVSGKEHPDTLTSMNNLAAVLGNQAKYEEAEQMHREVLAVKERVLGKEHPDTLASMNNLAVALGNQAKYEEASTFHQKAVEGYRKALGRKHPTSVICQRNYASMLEKMNS